MEQIRCCGKCKLWGTYCKKCPRHPRRIRRLKAKKIAFTFIKDCVKIISGK